MDERLNHANVHKTFFHYFIKFGEVPCDIFSDAQLKLRLRYQNASPIPLAIKAVRPLVCFTKSRHDMIPKILRHNRQNSLVAKWVREDMIKRKKERRLAMSESMVITMQNILEGKSSLYQKRYAMHKAGFI